MENLYVADPWMEGLKEWGPVEVTTHNLYFHEDASVFTMDGNGGLVATGGGDKDIRLWRVEKGSPKDKDFCYTTAASSSVRMKYHGVLSGHRRSVNCVRFAGDLLASCGDGGEVIVWGGEAPHVARKMDGDDAYEVVWGNGHLFVGLSSGSIAVYRVDVQRASERSGEEDKGDLGQDGCGRSLLDDEGGGGYGDAGTRVSSALVQSVKAHADVIQGLAFNDRFGLLTSLGKDRVGKTFLFDTRLVEIEKMEHMGDDKVFSAGKGFFRRLCYSPDGKLLYLACCRSSSVVVLHYPFRMEHVYATIGPLDSEPLKIMCSGNRLFVGTRKSLYVFVEQKAVLCVNNISFMAITDGCVFEGVCFVSSLDGFLSSLRMRE